MLLLSGIFLGLYDDNFGILGNSIKLISVTSPSSILAIFLPVLIFDSSFKTEWHIFKKLSGQSLILGILSTLVSATIIMLLTKLYVDSENVWYNSNIELFRMGRCIHDGSHLILYWHTVLCQPFEAYKCTSENNSFAWRWVFVQLLHLRPYYRTHACTFFVIQYYQEVK